MSDILPKAMTIANWMHLGPAYVARHATATITDRSPVWFKDRYTPSGAWGWEYGWRWLAPEEPDTQQTLPEEIFECLPPCPYPAVIARRAQGFGAIPRWPTQDEAIAALHIATRAWAHRQFVNVVTG